MRSAQTVVMTEKEILKGAKAIQKELVAIRRELHRRAELGFDLPKTTAFVGEKLREYGYAPKPCGKSGVVAEIGKGKGALLLRADTDGLPIAEKTGLNFACKNGCMHACGHDLHAAALLGAAKLLKENERALKGKIKLLFQPAEEVLQGAKAMIDSGVLESPKVTAAMMLHVLTATPFPTGKVIVAMGTSAPAADFFTITVRGKSAHGAAAQNGVDALSAAAHILVALQEISARELSPATPAPLTVGKCVGGTAANVLADRVELSGTLRAFDEQTRGRVKRRMEEICKAVAKAFRAKASVRYDSGCPCLVNDERLSAFALKRLQKTLGKERALSMAELGGTVTQSNGGSEDFAYISHAVPSVMIGLAAGNTADGYTYPLHHSKTKFDEDALCIGAAIYASMAFAWQS